MDYAYLRKEANRKALEDALYCYLGPTKRAREYMAQQALKYYHQMASNKP